MSSNPMVNLAALSLRQLREMARSIGILRYNSENREGLAEAITDRVNDGSLPLADLAALEAEMRQIGRAHV